LIANGLIDFEYWLLRVLLTPVLGRFNLGCSVAFAADEVPPTWPPPWPSLYGASVSKLRLTAVPGRYSSLNGVPAPVRTLRYFELGRFNFFCPNSWTPSAVASAYACSKLYILI